MASCTLTEQELIEHADAYQHAFPALEAEMRARQVSVWSYLLASRLE